MDGREQRILLAFQVALLGEVSAKLRRVSVILDNESIHFDCYFDGEIDDDDRESMSCVESEVMSFFPDTQEITHKVIRCDAPEPVPKSGRSVYCRRESEHTNPKKMF